MNTRFQSAATLVAALFIPSLSWAENEVGFIEKFALAPDREKVLGELVPGSDDYYFFHALHFQNTRNEAKLSEVLKAWQERMPDENPRRRTILNREALLDYDATPRETLDYLKERLGVELNHEQEARDQKPNLPVALDTALIARGVFLSDTLNHDSGLQSLSVEAVEALVAARTRLSDQQHQAALAKLTRPDVPNIVEFVAAGLRMNSSRNFGQFPIHKTLLPEQLDQLAKLVPTLDGYRPFVFAKMRKLAPSADVDLDSDPSEREAWLERLWAYAKTLPTAFNTEKAHILYQRLDHDRKSGKYDQARFIDYLKLPRQTGYANSRWLEKVLTNQGACDLSANLSEPLLRSRPIGNDEELVREYLMALFQTAARFPGSPEKNTAELQRLFAEYVDGPWLEAVLAEALITAGIGKPEQWASLISPQQFAKLKERVDIEFPRTNQEQFRLGSDVAFDVTLKNTPKVIVKIYELNALNFFESQKRQLNTDLNLDGLVANSERTETFDTGPFRRTTKKFDFPELKGRRGAWIIEFIGGGRSSRALVNVGQWQILQTVSPAGDLIAVVDENGEQIKDAVAWLDGRKFAAEAKLGGRIAIPFTAQPGNKQLIVGDASGSFATLTQFEHHAEKYVLDAQFHVEREQLLARKQATIGIRVALMLGESQIAPELLRESKLSVTSTTHDGIKTTKEFRDLKLGAGAIVTQEITVPERLASLTATLEGKVKILSEGGQERDLSATKTWNVNAIDKTDATRDGHLAKFGNDYVYQLLGKNGEPIPESAITFTFKHRGFERTQTQELKTDEKGRVVLGALAGIERIHAQPHGLRDLRWDLAEFERTWSSAIHTGVGQAVRIPLPSSLRTKQPEQAIREHISLLAVQAGTFTADHAEKIQIEEGFIVINGLKPGDYSLRLRGEARDISIKISGGRPVGGWYLGAARNLQAKAEAPLQIVSISADAAGRGRDADAEKFITIKLANVTPFTRVHIAATRFEPGLGIFGGLSGFARFTAGSIVPARHPNLYSTGREIGDEYRYILDRRYSKAFPGNMLTRPGLLLNPWEVRNTDLNELEQLSRQDAASTSGGRRMATAVKGMEAQPLVAHDATRAGAETNLDFLAASAPVIFNLIPEADGTVKIPREALGDRHHLQVYAEDLGTAVWRKIALAEQGIKLSDRRLAKALDPAKPFTQRKEVTVLQKGGQLALSDILTSEMETYETLGGIHSLFTTLSGDGYLAEFAWLLNWPKLNDDEKRAKYSEFACHELHFFLSRKDPAFFESVIKPYLENKKDKTFLDEYLLGADLAAYLQPSEFGRLNTAERALLATRLKGNAAEIARNIRELWELLPSDPDEQDRLFETALRGREMEEIPAEENAPTADAAPTPSAPTAAAFRIMKSAALSASDPVPTPAAMAIPGAIPGAMRGRVGESSLSQLNRAGVAFAAKEMDALAETEKLGATDEFLEKKKEQAVARHSALRGAKGALAELDKSSSITSEAYFGVDAAKDVTLNFRPMFRSLGATKELAENNYYKTRISEQDADFITPNAFWRDYAAYVAAGSKGAFVSENIAQASRSFSEMMLALAVLDLPFEAPTHASKSEGTKFTLTAGGPVIVYHKEIKPADAAAAQAGQLLVSQSFFQANDRYRQEGNEQFEKYVTDEFLTGTVYGANVVVTNPTSSPAKAAVLLQIPQGALPVQGSKATNSRNLQLAPYTTKTFEYFFYFPATAPEGKKFQHFPVNVAAKNAVAGSAKPFEFSVVNKLTQFDKASWAYVSQYGSETDVFAFLGRNNLASLELHRVAWRCRDASFFKKLTTFLREHHVWDETIYSYALLHNDPASLREWLKHNDQFVSECGPFLASKLLILDPIARRAYEHLEYSPLVNQRAHKLGADFRIANPAVREQYKGFLNILAHKPKLDAIDAMTVSYHMFLQDRVEEALVRFKSVEAKSLPTQIQHDYFRCYAGFYEGNLAEARSIAAKYAAHPVTRWRTLFDEVTSQLDEIEGKAAAKGTKPDREKQQSELAATEPVFDFKVEKQSILLNHKNLGDVTINYYLMDPEFSFSSNPFVSEDASRFRVIKPNKSAVQPLTKDKETTEIALPAELAKANVLVEIVGAGQRKTQAYHANTLKLTLAENFGRLETRNQSTEKPVAKAYIKVYARLKNGTVRFYKDGYTDLRGRFDYASLNGPDAQAQPQPAKNEAAPKNGLDYQMLKPDELGNVEKLSILVLSETNGATTREATPPAR
jgi:hypothetical protein